MTFVNLRCRIQRGVKCFMDELSANLLCMPFKRKSMTILNLIFLNIHCKDKFMMAKLRAV